MAFGVDRIRMKKLISTGAIYRRSCAGRASLFATMLKGRALLKVEISGVFFPIKYHHLKIVIVH